MALYHSMRLIEVQRERIVRIREEIFKLQHGICKLKYKPSRDIPRFVREKKTFSPKEIVEIILRERNKKTTPQSVTNWFRRHPIEFETLKKEVVTQELPQEEVSSTIFENGTFEEIPVVKQWIQEMQDKPLAPSFIKNNVGTLKRICLGKFLKWNLDLVESGEWCFKHPNRLTVDDVQNLCRIIKVKGLENYQIRMTSRAFFTSKGDVVGSKISGSKQARYGLNADLFVEMHILRQILDEVAKINFEAYEVDLFMFKTGTRIEATLEAKIEELHVIDKFVKIIDKGSHAKGRKTWRKYIDYELLKHISRLTVNRQSGKIFSLDAQTMSNINREAMKKNNSRIRA